MLLDPKLLKDKQVRLLAANHPLRVQTVDYLVPEGLNIQQMLDLAQPDPMLLRDAVVYVGDQRVNKEYWHLVKPKAGAHVTARVLPVPASGGGGGKSPLRMILSLVVIAAALIIPAMLPTTFVAGVGTFLGATDALALSLGATVLSGLISFAGMLLINALVPIKPPSTGSGQTEDSSVFITGQRNRARPFDVIPQVLGHHRMSPDFAARPYTEVLGDHNIYRALFCYGYGEVTIADVKIGETLITNFTDYIIENLPGSDTDPAQTLFPNQVDQTDLDVKLEQTLGWQTRTTVDNADELSVDIAFPRGLVHFINNQPEEQSVTMEIEYKLVTDVTWTKITAADVTTTFPTDFLTVDIGTGKITSITFTQARPIELRHGIRWPVATRGQYDVRMQRTTADLPEDNTEEFDEIHWVALRRFVIEPPINFRKPLALTALQIKATDQLNRIVDELNAVITSVCLDWDTGSQSWIKRATANPASLFRHVLQGPGIAIPFGDERIDLEALQYWHEFCQGKQFEFNMIRDFRSSVWECLFDIAGAGRASLLIKDGKWSVAVDEPRNVIKTHVTPRNSWGFEMEKAFIDSPHGWRIRFTNEEDGWRADERVVYRDGFDANNSELYNTMSLPGVTHPDQIYKLGRYHIAAGLNQPERWSFNQDFESVVVNRGDRILITHDVILTGLGSGRVKTLLLDGPQTSVIGVTTDEKVFMDAGEEYAISFRSVNNTNIVAEVVTAPGETQTLMFITPILVAQAPEAGDLFGFGNKGSVTEDGLILNIQRQSDFVARLTAVPYREAIYQADSGPIPDFVPNISPLEDIPIPRLISIISDESALVIGSTHNVEVRINLTVEPPANFVARLEVQGRTYGTSEPFFSFPVEQVSLGGYSIGGVHQGVTYDLRCRWIVEDRIVPGPYLYLSPHTVVGKSTPPSPLDNLTISVFGGQAFMRWDPPPELDVIYGGYVKFRHSQLMTGATWADSTSIGQATAANSLFATLPLKSGTYLARVYDVDENFSDFVSVTTEQASVLTYAAADSLDEAPTFGGTHTGTVVVDDALQLDSTTASFDSIPDFDAVPDLDSYGLMVDPSGVYDFEFGFDFLVKTKIRLTTRITAVSFNVNDYIDSRETNIDDWADFDGVDQAEGDMTVWVRYTDDDPSGTPTWSAWQRLDSGEFDARGFDFQARLSTTDPTYNILVTELGIDAEEVV